MGVELLSIAQFHPIPLYDMAVDCFLRPIRYSDTNSGSKLPGVLGMPMGDGLSLDGAIKAALREARLVVSDFPGLDHGKVSRNPDPAAGGERPKPWENHWKMGKI